MSQVRAELEDRVDEPVDLALGERPQLHGLHPAGQRIGRGDHAEQPR
nr:hypothetical protein [Actinoplanes ianthinogenes]